MSGKHTSLASSLQWCPCMSSSQDAHRSRPTRPKSHANPPFVDDVRRSGRANKGHHTKNQDLFDEPVAPVAKPKSKGKSDKKGSQAQGARSESIQSGAQPEPEPEDEEEAIIRCVCGDQRDIRGRQMICCDRCSAWQHVKCLGLLEGPHWEEESTTYFCEQCKPEEHVDLLAAMARGEKPWNRKKGSKAAKLKSRPSDVRSEGLPETPIKSETPSKTQKLEVPKVPTPQTSSTPVQAPAPVPAPTPVPTSIEPPTDLPSEASNGHADHKVASVPSKRTSKAELPVQSKKSTPKSQSQSPSGEKRGQDAIVEREVPKPKRRKSSIHAATQPAQSTLATDISHLPEKQMRLVENLVKTLIGLIKEASDAGKYRIPDGATPSSIATRLGLQIDHAAIGGLGEPTTNASRYVLQFRAIVFNMKQNSTLVERLLSGALSPEELVVMKTEDMASEEQQQQYATIREANEKQMILTEVTGKRLRKTHKGEEWVGEDEDTLDHELRPPELRDREIGQEGAVELPSPNRDGQTIVELPEDVGQRASLSVDTANQTDSIRRPSTNFDIGQIFSQVKSPQKDQHTFLQRRQSSIRVQGSHDGPGDDADVDRLLKDEENDVEMTGYAADPTIVWQGKLEMQSTGPFDAVARFVAGGDFGLVIPWDQLLPPSLPIQGRIESHRGNEYIQGLATSGSHDVGVLSISPVSHDGRAIMDHLYSYFHDRDRWGVVPVERFGNDTLRDLYVIPIPAGGKTLPGFLEMLEYCTIETPRKEPLVLLALVAKLPDMPQFAPTEHFDRYPAGDIAGGQVAHPTPAPPGNGQTNGPAPSPVNPHGPQYSPMGPAFPQDQMYGNQYAPPPYHNGAPPSGHHSAAAKPLLPHEIPHAQEILGPFFGDPVVQQFLSATPPVTLDQMKNIRSIVEEAPATRTDMNAFIQHMTLKQQKANQVMQG
ncbi:hypothetical protein K504DRAFT_530429 [Pleomassaria siparia CBS 279.74]|uniref:Transcription factor BYE1 n=1 Tax=Pleomassaria siparia CBS 279.74 TaxID=1314801 RepID=A0A6G1KKT6_9PLEO|nr:hypothetical protein K504DRAFT_530429 [Pleomassaria siparia CBS 279.74]